MTLPNRVWLVRILQGVQNFMPTVSFLFSFDTKSKQILNKHSEISRSSGSVSNTHKCTPIIVDAINTDRLEMRYCVIFRTLQPLVDRVITFQFKITQQLTNPTLKTRLVKLVKKSRFPGSLVSDGLNPRLDSITSVMLWLFCSWPNGFEVHWPLGVEGAEEGTLAALLDIE